MAKGKTCLSARLGSAGLGMLVGAAVGSACGFGLEVAYIRFLYGYADQDAASWLFWTFLLPGLGAGILLGAAMGWRNASRGHRSVASPCAGSDVAPLGLPTCIGWVVFGTVVGGVLLGAAALGLGIAYDNAFPIVPDEGTSGYAILLVILPAGFVAGSICGAIAGWYGAAWVHRRIRRRSRGQFPTGFASRRGTPEHAGKTASRKG